ncbi:hypothetical protein OH77DRAFT_1525540 [Trametes cingulata]|nr:hypothetical protein OH77DRAFT_1525540 [Trametes cingulata]
MSAKTILPNKWMTPAIVANIVHHIPLLGVAYDRNVDYKTLLALSVTCRALSKPALDLMWQKLPSLIPLLRTLPCDLWTEVPANLDGLTTWHYRAPRKHMDFVRPLEVSDFKRFRTYAPRIKHISRTALDDIPVNISMTPGAYAALEEFSLISLSLPNLRTLEIDYYVRSLAAAPLHVFRYPKLRSLRFTAPPRSLDHFEQRISSLFDGLRLTSRQLTHVHLGNDEHLPVVVRQAVMDAIGGMPQLKELSCYDEPTFPPAMLCQIARFPKLRSISIGIRGRATAGTASFPELPAGCFTALKELTLITDALAWVHSLIQSIKFDGLRFLSVRLTQPVSPTALQEFFVTLCICHPGLTRLDVALPYEDPRVETLSAHSMYPLLRLRRLLLLHMGSCPVAVDETLVRAMSLAWRDIEELIVTIEVDEYPSLVSLSALVHLAANCRKLHRIGLPLDAEKVPPRLLSVPYVGQPNEQKIDLFVGRSKVGCPLDVAAYLSDMFPNLRQVYTEWEYDVGYLDSDDEDAWEYLSVAEEQWRRWEEAEKFMQALWRIRLQERNDARAHGRTFRGPHQVLSAQAAKEIERQRWAVAEQELEKILSRAY